MCVIVNTGAAYQIDATKEGARIAAWVAAVVVYVSTSTRSKLYTLNMVR